MNIPAIFTESVSTETGSSAEPLAIKDVEQQIVNLLKKIQLSDQSCANDLVDNIKLQSEVGLWPKGDVVISAYSGRNEGMYVSIQCFDDGKSAGISQFVAIKLFCSSAVAWRIANILDTAFENRAWAGREAYQGNQSAICVIDDNGNIRAAKKQCTRPIKPVQSSFVGIMARARNINRWPLMSEFKSELLCEHIYQCAYVGHLLGAIAADVFGEDIDPDKVASMGIFHEVSEFYMNDMPSTAKYKSPAITSMIKKLEREYETIALDSLPEQIQDRYREYVIQDKSEIHAALSKAADVICAHLKCEFELSKGNTEFEVAKLHNDKVLNAFREKYPCVDYFCDAFLSTANDTVDSQMQGAGWVENALRSHI